VIEFGPGTGAVTAQIAHRLPNPECYLGIERDAHFVEHLRDRYPDLPFVHGSAEEAVKHHAEKGLGAVRAIICGLPFASLPGAVQDAVIDQVDELLTPGAEFRTFQYVHAYTLPSSIRFRKRMAVRFGQMSRSPVVLRNLPPAYVLTWRR